MTFPGILVRGPKETEFVQYEVGTPIAPGSSVEVRATMASQFSRNGKKTAIYLGVEGEAERISLLMLANPTPFFSLEVESLSLGSFPHGNAQSGSGTIRTTNGEPCLMTLDPIALAKSPKGLGIELHAVDPDADGRASEWRVEAELGADAALGAKRFHVPIASDIKIEGAAEGTTFSTGATVMYCVRGPLEAAMNYVSFGLVQQGREQERKVRLTRYNSEVDLSRLVAEVSLDSKPNGSWRPEVQATLVPVRRNADSVDLVLEWPAAPAGTSGVFRGHVTVKTGQPDVPELTIKFSGVCR